MTQSSNNPLAKHFRQPKLYIKLPSNGNFYPAGSIEFTESGEYPVYAMTAKDELKIKTPDALMNGQATVDVIQSCMPNIKNAWFVPNIDLDTILIAIRIATYGEKFDIDFTLPGTEIEKSYQIDLRTLLDQFHGLEFNNVIQKDNFIVEIKPSSYKLFTETALKTFEEQRIFALLDNEEMSDADKLKVFNESFERLTNLNLSLVINSVVSIIYGSEEPVTNRAFIEEFFDNAEKGLFKAILDHIEQEKEKFSIKPFTVTTTEEEQAAGAPATFEIPINFDQSNFFG